MNRRAFALIALAAVHGVAGCASETDKAASRLGEALSALGLNRMEWRSARVEGERIVLIGAKGELDGAGPVQAEEISVEGYKPGDDGWSAVAVTADRVAGAFGADRLVLRDVSAKRMKAGWDTVAGARYVQAYEGPLFGRRVSVTGGGVSRISGERGRQVTASGLRMLGSQGLQGPCDVSARTSTAPDGNTALDFERASCPGLALRGRIVVSGADWSGGALIPSGLADAKVMQAEGEASAAEAPSGTVPEGLVRGRHLRLKGAGSLTLAELASVLADKGSWEARGIEVVVDGPVRQPQPDPAARQPPAVQVPQPQAQPVPQATVPQPTAPQPAAQPPAPQPRPAAAQRR